MSNFFEKVKKVHNNKYNYSNFLYINSKTKGVIICPQHGEFLQRPNDHLNGQGCKKCSIKNNSIRLQYNTNQFIEKSINKHGTIYDYSSVNYIGTYNKVSIICPIHGEFFQTPNSHLNGSGCKKCYHKNKILTNEDFIKRAITKHGYFYSYDKSTYETYRTKIKIICPIHGEFNQSPGCHLNGRGCPKCHMSKGEISIKNELDNRNIKYVVQKTFDDCRNPKTNYLLKYDFYLPKENLFIEYDGKQHFKCDVYIGKRKTTITDLTHTQYLDNLKNEYCRNKNIKLIRIKYTEKEKIPVIIDKICANGIFV